MLQQDAQAEYILKHLEDYYSSHPDMAATGSDDDSAVEAVVDEAAAATREGARLVIERALFELARFGG